VLMGADFRQGTAASLCGRGSGRLVDAQRRHLGPLRSARRGHEVKRARAKETMMMLTGSLRDILAATCTRAGCFVVLMRCRAGARACTQAGWVKNGLLRGVYWAQRRSEGQTGRQEVKDSDGALGQMMRWRSGGECVGGRSIDMVGAGWCYQVLIAGMLARRRCCRRCPGDVPPLAS
jgi:hypothetical protein